MQQLPTDLLRAGMSDSQKSHRKFLPHKKERKKQGKNKRKEEGEKTQVIALHLLSLTKPSSWSWIHYDDVTHFNISLINPSVNLKPKFAAEDFKMHPSNIQADCI